MLLDRIAIFVRIRGSTILPKSSPGYSGQTIRHHNQLHTSYTIIISEKDCIAQFLVRPQAIVTPSHNLWLAPLTESQIDTYPTHLHPTQPCLRAYQSTMPQKVTHHCPRQNHRGRCVNVKSRKNISPFYCRTHKILCTRHRPAIAHLKTEECPSCAKALLIKTKKNKCVIKKGTSAKKRSGLTKECAPTKWSSSLQQSKSMKK